MPKQIALFIASLTIISCGDSATETTVVTTVITSNGSATDVLPQTSGDTSSTTEGDETTDGDATDGVLTTTSGPNPTTGYEPPEHCIKNENGSTPPVTCEPHEGSWCDEVADFAAQHLPEPYAGIAVKNCESTGDLDPCGVCFYIANTCAQVAGPCDENLTYICGCLAQAHGAI